MENKSNINVEIRIKPSLENSLENTETSVTVGTKTYNFHKIHLTTTQKQLYEGSVKHLVDRFTSGYNCTVIAYGQTGSGKTYTMGISASDVTGIVPQAMEYLFKDNLVLSCTFIEIYNEDVIDLLGEHKVPLNLREIKGEVNIAGVTEIDLKSAEECLKILKKGCLERTTKSTKMNSQSSRSHAIFTLFLRTEINGNFVTSKFSFVDLAGSERLKRTMCIGERAKESISINSGLLALGNVISALYKKNKHIPFRDSKLTRILNSCLNGFVLMIACISSSHSDMNETHNTLKYANRAASIQTTVKMNIEVDNTKMAILMLKKEIQKLKTENQILRDKIRKNLHVNVESLMRENRELKIKLDNVQYNNDLQDKSEDLAQEILKHPFVQNLINENQKLNEEMCKFKKSQENSKSDDKVYNDIEDECVKVKFGDSRHKLNYIEKSFGHKLKNRSDAKPKVMDVESTQQINPRLNNNSLKRKLDGCKKDKMLNVENGFVISTPINVSRSKPPTISPDSENKLMVGLNSLEIDPETSLVKKNVLNESKEEKFEIETPIKEACPFLSSNNDLKSGTVVSPSFSNDENKSSNNTEQKFSWNEKPDMKAHKRQVTFKIEEPKKRYALFTPRKEKILMETKTLMKINGYLPHSMTIYNDDLVFSSIDNKVRAWKNEVVELFSDNGVRCIEASDILYYTTRMILKQYDARIGFRPVYAFKNEISSLKKIGNNVYTGHEDGSISILDIRNNKVLSNKVHLGTVFCIEKIKDTLYTGSRDHTIKAHNNGTSTLTPPHYDSVQVLLSYKGDLVSLGRDCSLKRWRDTKIVKTVPYAHDSWIKSGEVLEDSFVSGSKNGTLRFWDFCDNSVFCVGKVKVNGAVNCILKNGNGIFIGTQNKEILYMSTTYIK